MSDGSALVQRYYLAVGLTEKPGDGTDAFRRRLPPRDHFPISIAENAIDRVHPGARGSVVKSVSPGGVRRNHSAKSTEASTRRIDRKAESALSCRDIQSRPENAGISPDRSAPLIEFPQVIDSREIHDDSLPDCAARHAAPGAAWNESRSGLCCPPHQRDHIVRIDGHRYSCRNRASDSRRFRVDGASEVIFAKRPAKPRRSHWAEPRSTGRSLTTRGCSRAEDSSSNRRIPFPISSRASP